MVSVAAPLALNENVPLRTTGGVPAGFANRYSPPSSLCSRRPFASIAKARASGCVPTGTKYFQTCPPPGAAPLSHQKRFVPRLDVSPPMNTLPAASTSSAKLRRPWRPKCTCGWMPEGVDATIAAPVTRRPFAGAGSATNAAAGFASRWSVSTAPATFVTM